LYKIVANPLFQSREVREFDTSRHIPPKFTFSFNEDDYFKDIPMLLNPCYESSLHHDNHVPDRKVPRGDTNWFDEFIDHPFKVQTLNPKSNSIDTFIITSKEYVGWHVLEIGDRFFWLLINHISASYTFVDWHVGSPSMHKFFKLIGSACKAGDTFLYAKFHPT
jgi:hypothetical protein